MATFVLIPGAGGQAWYWHRVVPLLIARGHRAIAVELPAGDAEAGWAAYTDTAVSAAGAAGPDGSVIVVGQSMGGFTAPLVAERLGAERIVLLNAMVPKPGETGGQWWETVGQRAARVDNDRREGRDPDAPFDEREMFFHDVPDDITEEAFAGDEPAQSDRPFAETWPLETWPDIPTSGIAGADDRIFPVDFQQRVARERLGIELAVVPGGHLVALSNPKAVVDVMLEQCGLS